MSITINIELNQKSVNDAIKDLQEYKARLHEKMVEFVEELSQVGIRIAKSSVDGKFSGYVEFDREVGGSGSTVTAVVMGYNSQTMEVWWYYHGGRKVVEVDAIKMAEFGSGLYAEDGWRGTFPGQTHAEDPPWGWTDDTGHHISSGEVPTRPMHKAALEMINQIESIARKVFSS